MKRLCDPKEQKHLANIVTLYRIHTRINDKSPAEKRMKTTPAVAALPPAEAPAAIMAYADKLKGFKGRPLPENFELLRVTDDLLTAIIRNLGAQGYMRKWNFGLTDDPLVSKAFENLHSGVPDCKT